ncbi:MAG TPA: glucose 1-dehydrogenase [Anaerolineales bacterium]|nr:glucose 1-dehydrogenase [Anaerolineales bacterium]
MGTHAGLVAIVTGGSRGIGAAISRQLAEAGAKVMIVYYDGFPEKAEELMADIRGGGGDADVLRLDLSSLEGIRQIMPRTLEAFGGVDILVACAGVARRVWTLEATEEDWNYHVNINARGVYFSCQEAGQQMVQQGRGGRIVLISSVVGHRGEEGHTPYLASKGAVEQIGRGLAMEWAAYGITVNCVAPGATMTDLIRPSLTPEVEREVVKRIPMGRIGRPEDVAAAVMFFTSPEAGYVTGQVLDVDGGLGVDVTAPRGGWGDRNRAPSLQPGRAN